MTLVDFDLRDRIAAVLIENQRRAPRVQATAVLRELGDALVPVATDEGVELRRPEPPRWARYAERNAPLLAAGVATTRNRTHEAIRSLGLEPEEIRAVVIEADTVHVFRWTDAGTRVGIGLPIVED